MKKEKPLLMHDYGFEPYRNFHYSAKLQIAKIRKYAKTLSVICKPQNLQLCLDAPYPISPETCKYMGRTCVNTIGHRD